MSNISLDYINVNILVILKRTGPLHLDGHQTVQDLPDDGVFFLVTMPGHAWVFLDLSD